MSASLALAIREWQRFFRQRNRVIGAFGQPLLFWLLFSGGLGPSFKPAGTDASYAEYFFPGILVLIVLFTAIFATISVIEDRREGVLQAVLVSPISDISLALGKVAGGTLIAVMQACLFLCLSPWAGLSLSPMAVVLIILDLGLLGFGLTSLGLIIAWKMESTQGFHAIMSLLLMPMWLLSGAFFPATGVAWPLAWLMQINPLSFGLASLRQLFYLNSTQYDSVALLQSASLTLVFSGLAFACSVWLISRTRSSR